MNKRAILGGILFSILVLLLGACQKAEKGLPRVAENRKLEEQSKEFEKGIYKVTDGVYSAVGYGIANVIMLVGKDGVIIVDTMTTIEEGNEVWNDLRKLTPLPLKAIIYTHFHPDHIFGASAFAGKKAPEIYAHESLDESVSRGVGETAPMNGSRSMRMYG
ncbi:MAG: MBL fold metallo-hydrolase, partial [Deltaproteobacteria bacterium]